MDDGQCRAEYNIIFVLVCLFSSPVTSSDLYIVNITLVWYVGNSVSVTRMAVNNFTPNHFVMHADCVFDSCDIFVVCL